MKKNLQKGFTIVELIIVIAVIGILASVLIPTYSDVVTNANDSAALQTVRSTMTNWLAKYTTPSGVPTSKKDSNGIMHYAAYFVYENEDEAWQYRYTKQGVEEVPKDEIIDWDTCTKVEDAYLDDPTENTDAEATTVYTVKITEDSKTSTYYYAKLAADSDYYSLGGADVYAVCKKYYTSTGSKVVLEAGQEENYTITLSVGDVRKSECHISELTVSGYTISVTLNQTVQNDSTENVDSALQLKSGSKIMGEIDLPAGSTNGSVTLTSVTGNITIDDIELVKDN